MTRRELIARIDALLLLEESQFQASRQTFNDVLRECRDAIAVAPAVIVGSDSGAVAAVAS